MFLLRSISMTLSNSAKATTVTVLARAAPKFSSTLGQAEMSFDEIRAEVKCAQGVAVGGVVFARNIIAFVSVFFAGFGKDAHECRDALLVVKIWFQRLDRLSVSI